MMTARLLLAGTIFATAGCAHSRPYSPATPGGPAPTLPDTTPSLGAPADSPPSGSGSFFRGDGPELKMPEALRDDPLPRSRRLSSRWSSASPATGSGQRAAAAADPVSTSRNSALDRQPVWDRTYRSTDRRAIETFQAGSGPQRVAILSSLHGDEAQSVTLVEELARHLAANPAALSKSTVLLVKSPNPDGLSSRSPYNVHGVDLNRNFPSDNWQHLQNGRSGAKASSEPETRAVMRILSEFRPTLLVHLKDSRDVAVVNSEGNVSEQAEQVAAILRGTAVRGLGAKTTGSLEHYARTHLDCPSLTILSRPEAGGEAAWARNREALLAVVAATPRAPRAVDDLDARELALEERSRLFKRPEMKKSSLRESDRSEGSRSGTRSKAALPADPIPDHGYVELPPP